MDRTIRAGDGIVCRVNGTFEHYIIGTVVSGKAGALLLRAVSTMVGQHSAVRHAYQQRMHDSRVWLFGGAAGAYLEAAAPAGREFCGDTVVAGERDAAIQRCSM